MSVHELGELGAETRTVIEEYLAALEVGFCQVTADMAQDALDEIRSHILGELDADASPDVARGVLTELGQPDEYATALCAAIRGEVPPVVAAAHAEEPALAQPSMRILGMPADFKMPTPENLQSRMWNPADPRIFTPRLIGIGWSINFASLAVRLGIIRPDDEDVPFGSTPEGWLWGTLTIPVTLALGVVVAYVSLYASLPAELPIHWGANGAPDGFASKAAAIVPLLAAMLAAAGYAIWTFGGGRSKTARVLVVAFATMVGILSASIIAVSLAWGLGIEVHGSWPNYMLAVAFAVPFIELVLLSRLGRNAEMLRDINREGSPKL